MIRFIEDNYVPQQPEMEQTLKVNRLATLILGKFFGTEWFERHFCVSKNWFLRVDISRWSEDGWNEMYRALIRINNLAEMLINLQDFSGFDGCLQLLADGNIEAAFAELEVGKILSAYNVPFRFNRRTGKPKLDYDVGLSFRNGVPGCADTKCLLESTAMSDMAILERLKKARSQLPDNMPGAVFIKLPEEWTLSKDFIENLRRAVGYFFYGYKKYPGTKTVVVVETYSSFIESDNGTVQGVE